MWLAKQESKMKQVLCCDLLTANQDGTILTAQDCPLAVCPVLVVSSKP